MVMGLRAEVLMAVGMEADARRLADRLLTETDLTDLVIREATAENSVGRVLQKLGAFDRAEERYRRAFERSTAAGFRYEAAQALDGLADVAEQSGRADRAREHRERADRLFSEMRVPKTARRLC
jgi:tetratricopeptide (TPR) repeat protein